MSSLGGRSAVFVSGQKLWIFVWRELVVWGAGLCRIGGVGGPGEGGRVGGLWKILRA